jgi:phospholipase/carboxylesterase
MSAVKPPEIKGLNAEFVPASLASGKLLIVLHGLGDSLEGYRFLPEFLRFKNLNYLLLNAPDSYFGGYSWFDIYGDPSPGVIRSRALLMELLQDLARQGWKAGNIGLFGFSQGALMSMDAGFRSPERLAAIVAISGYVYLPKQLALELGPRAKEIPTLATHGTHDSVLPISQTRSQIAELCGLGLNIRWKEYVKEHTIEPQQEASDIRAFLKESMHVE